MAAGVSPLPLNAAAMANIPQSQAPSEENVTLTATIQTLPDKLASLTRPLQINGIPLAPPENGVITLQTAAGNLTLQLLAATNNGDNALADMLMPLVLNQKPLSLTLQPNNPSAQALVTLPNLAASQTSLAATNSATPEFSAFLQKTVVSGQEMTATILPQAVAKAFSALASVNEAVAFVQDSNRSGETFAKAPILASLTTVKDFLTTSLKTTFLNDFLKTATSTKLPDVLKNFIATALPETATTQTASSMQPASLNAEAPTLSIHTDWQVRVDAIVQPDKPLPTSSSPTQLAATLVGKGPDGQLILSASDKTLFIRQFSDLPVGSKLLLTPLAPKTEPEFPLEPLTDYKANALHDVMAALASIEPQLAQQLMQTRIPQPNAILPGTLLFLFNALNQNGVQGWLGSEALDRLGRLDKLELVSKLAEEMQHASGTAHDPVIGQWRSWPLPLYNGQNFDMLHLYVRRDRDRQNENAGYPVSPQTRFLVTMNMTRLGPMQLDGLSQKKKLDLIVRSERSLPSGLPNELRGLYVKTLDALGLVGGINFQTGKQNWIDIQKTMERAGVVT